MVYNVYPAVDNVTNLFPPVVMTALGKSAELKNTVIPMTQADRNNLVGAELWTGRLIFNTTTSKINRYNAGWFEIDQDVRTDPLTLPAAPTLDLHAATKKYVDDSRPLSGRNRIINGDFSVNQRAATGATAGAYLVDRFKFWGNAPQGTATCTVTAATIGELPESAERYVTLATNGQTASDASSLLRQHIENVRTFSGKTVTVSFWAKAASGTPSVAVNLNQDFGTGGSPSTAVVLPGNKVAITNVWARYSLSFDVPSISGKFIGTTANTSSVIADIWTSAGTNFNMHTNSLGIQNATISLWGIQIEEGSIVTPYERKSYAEELRACQRYYVAVVNAGLDTQYQISRWSTQRLQ
jgi:Carbohydrate binding domain